MIVQQYTYRHRHFRPPCVITRAFLALTTFLAAGTLSMAQPQYVEYEAIQMAKGAQRSSTVTESLTRVSFTSFATSAPSTTSSSGSTITMLFSSSRTSDDASRKATTYPKQSDTAEDRLHIENISYHEEIDNIHTHHNIAHHGHGDYNQDHHKHGNKAPTANISNLDESYFAYRPFRGLMYAHIFLMTLGWGFILPVGIMLSLAESRLALMVQLVFCCVHGFGSFLGTVYRYNTPELYEKNAHNTIGWFATLLVILQSTHYVVRSFTRSRKDTAATETLRMNVRSDTFGFEESESCDASNQQSKTSAQSPRNQNHEFLPDQSTQGPRSTRSSESLSSSSTLNHNRLRASGHSEDHSYRDESDAAGIEKRGLLRSSSETSSGTGGSQHRARLAARGNQFSVRGSTFSFAIRFAKILGTSLDRIILLLGFVAIVSGVAVYSGIWRANNIFNGLAHAIKGGIFFWYGLLTFGRWMGCFAENGWAWNMKPPVGVVNRRQASIPSAEFVESFVIFLYGSTNVFLEHLAAWGGAWTAQDLEHVSITLMFFGGGLCGMLIESTRIRNLLNTIILSMNMTTEQHSPRPSTVSFPMRDELSRGPRSRKKQETHEWQAPKTYAVSLNPFPALIILLLGLMMSSHHQHSMTSTMVHKQWGTLFVGFALARAITYILTYITPPSSYLPSRPPPELISAFCLISGGIIFMASNRDTVNAMESLDLQPMFLFTVTMGLTAFIMAWTILVLAIKGWALRRRRQSRGNNSAQEHDSSV